MKMIHHFFFDDMKSKMAQNHPINHEVSES